MVGGEVQPVERAARIGQHRLRQPRLVERQRGGARRQQRCQAGGDAGGVEGGDQHGCGAGFGQRRQRTRDQAEPLTADLAHVLDEHRVRLGHVRRERVKRLGDTFGVEQTERAGPAQAVGQAGQRLGGEGMRERLVEHVAALALVEGRDLEHGHPLAGKQARGFAPRPHWGLRPQTPVHSGKHDPISATRGRTDAGPRHRICMG